VLELRELAAQLRDPARVQAGRGDQDLGGAQRQALPQRLGPEGREQGEKTAPSLSVPSAAT